MAAKQGQLIAIGVAVAPGSSYTKDVQVNLAGPPIGITTDPITLGYADLQGTLNISVANAALGANLLLVSATDGDESHTAIFSLMVTAPDSPNFSISIPNGNLIVVRGTTASMVIDTASIGGFQGNIAMSLTGLPSGLSATPEVTIGIGQFKRQLHQIVLNLEVDVSPFPAGIYASLFNASCPLRATVALHKSAGAVTLPSDVMDNLWGQHITPQDLGSSSYMIPIYYSQVSDPLRTISCTTYGACNGNGVQIHLPVGASAEPHDDGHLTVIDQASGIEFDGWRCNTSSAAALNCSWGGCTRLKARELPIPARKEFMAAMPSVYWRLLRAS